MCTPDCTPMDNAGLGDGLCALLPPLPPTPRPVSYDSAGFRQDARGLQRKTRWMLGWDRNLSEGWSDPRAHATALEPCAVQKEEKG
jgi:hypothetical protein